MARSGYAIVMEGYTHIRISISCAIMPSAKGHLGTIFSSLCFCLETKALYIGRSVLPKFNIKILLSNIFLPILEWEVKEKRNILSEIISTKSGQHLVKTVTMADFLKYYVFSQS